jgi:hypothetical protein
MGWDHLAGDSAFPTIPLLRILLSGSQALSFIAWDWLLACCVHWNCPSNIYLFYASKKRLCFIKSKISCFFLFAGFFIILESSKHLKFKMGIDIPDFHVFYRRKLLTNIETVRYTRRITNQNLQWSNWIILHLFERPERQSTCKVWA